MVKSLVKPWPLQNPSDLFDACKAEGWIVTILCHHILGVPLTASKLKGNHTLACREYLAKALAMLKARIGVSKHGIATIGVEDVLAGTEHLCLSLFWTIIKVI